MRCPACGNLDDRVVDSRTSEDGTAIRRRRECASCGRRFTTFERADELPLFVRKRSGAREPFDRTKIVAGLQAATKNRPVAADDLEALAASVEDHCRLEGGEVTSEAVGLAVLERLAAAVEEHCRLEGGEVTSEAVGLAVLERLREVDQVASVRFASVYKEFDDPADFARELGLLTKSTAPKAPES